MDFARCYPPRNKITRTLHFSFRYPFTVVANVVVIFVRKKLFKSDLKNFRFEEREREILSKRIQYNFIIYKVAGNIFIVSKLLSRFRNFFLFFFYARISQNFIATTGKSGKFLSNSYSNDARKRAIT